MREKIVNEKLEKDIRKNVDRGLKEAKKKVEMAKGAMELEEKKISEKIRERPLEWIGGAFIAGLLMGKILSK